jgi:prlF antitoxin for toxin YhaV_toxin
MPYTARATTSGTAPALAFTKAFANEHPEFTEGRFDVFVIAPGRMLVSAPVEIEADGGDDPVLETFLSFLDRQMHEHPELIRPFTADDVEGLDDLLAGAEVDLDGRIDDDFVLP